MACISIDLGAVFVITGIEQSVFHKLTSFLVCGRIVKSGADVMNHEQIPSEFVVGA